MDETELRQKIIEEAEEWLGTPFRHEARVKNVGVDCGNLLIATYEAAGLIPHLKVPHYPRDFMLHSDREWFLEIVLQYAFEIREEDLLPGDVAIFRNGRLYAHGAIVVDWPTVIHADVDEKIVVRADASLYPLVDKKRRFFRWDGFKKDCK